MENRRENVIATLESIRARKEMYLELPSIELADAFLAGFLVACGACGLNASWAAWHDAAKERGWLMDAGKPTAFLLSQGLTDEQVVDELFEIHLLALRSLKD